MKHIRHTASGQQIFVLIRNTNIVILTTRTAVCDGQESTWGYIKYISAILTVLIDVGGHGRCYGTRNISSEF